MLLDIVMRGEGRMRGYTAQEIREAMRLYAVTDSGWLRGRSLAQAVEEAVKGGATFVQIREKHLPYDAFTRLALEVKKVTDRYHIPYVVNDEVELAGQIDADGVHIGHNDNDLTEARRILPIP